MELRFSCPECDRTVQLEWSDATLLECRACNVQWTIPDRSIDGCRVRRCVVCSSLELFLRKDFPQRWGLAIVVAGLSLSCVTWYFYLVIWTFVVLFASALIDVLLYLVVGNVLTCYRCHTEYRGFDQSEHTGFELEVFERHRQQEARLKDRRHESEPGDDRGRPARAD